jgi:HEPN domain-containing protein
LNSYFKFKNILIIVREDFLKKRAKEFYLSAKRNFEEGFYNLSVFNAEQACQLFLKYLLYLKAGDYPKTYLLTVIMKELSKAYRKEEIEKFIEERSIELQALESAYLSSRYLGKEYDKNEAKALILFSEKLISFLENISNEKLL